MKRIGIDYGSKRVGVALTNDSGEMAFPKEVFLNDENLINTINLYIKENGVQEVVVGESKNYKQESNPISLDIKKFIESLKQKIDKPVYLHPEVLTTFEASRIQGKNDKTDASAASIILQSYIDSLNIRKKKGNIKDRLYAWMNKHSNDPKTRWWIFFVSAAESIFFPIPLEVMLIPAISFSKKSWFKYAMYASMGSVAGGIVGYLFGFFLYDLLGRPIIEFYNLTEEFEGLYKGFANNTFWSIFIAAFTPIPYKVFTLAAGFFKVSVLTFTLASILGRVIRYLVVGYVASLFGEAGAKIFYRYFNLISIISLALILLAIYIFV